MRKKLYYFVSILCIIFFGFSGCVSNKNQSNYNLLRIAVASDNYDPEAWNSIKDGFEKAYADYNVKLEVIISSEIEEVVEPMVSSGKTVDMMAIPQNRPSAYVENLIKSRAILPIDDIMDRKVYSEEVKLKDKIITGFMDTIATNIYQDGLNPDSTHYMLPLSYKTKGIIYNKDLFNNDGSDGKFKLSETYDNFLNLRYELDKRNENKEEKDRQYLFGYGEDSDLESFITCTIATTMGQMLTEKMLSYEYIYNQPQFMTALKKLEDINKSTEVGGGKGDYVLHSSLDGASELENLKAIINKKVLFVPGGIDEIEILNNELEYETTDFGFMSVFSANEQAQRYVGTEINPIFIMKGTNNAELCKEFMLYLYSDVGSEIFMKNTGLMMPVVNAKNIAIKNNIFTTNKLKTLDCFNNGERPFAYKFKRLDNTGVDWQNIYTRSLTNVFKGAQIADFWLTSLKTSSVEMRSALVEFNNK